jgi:iron complex transport system ATP-binding protein
VNPHLREPVLRIAAAGLVVAGRAILDGVDLELARGRLTVVVGPNGAGKTSLLRLAAGDVAPSSGRVRWNGIDVADLPVWRLAALRAVMSQSTEVGFAFTVAETIALGLDGVGRRLPAHARRSLVATAALRADVGDLLGRDVRTLSGGERQRVLFARALAQLDAAATIEPVRALLLDEPVSSLDLPHQLALMEAARRVADDGVAVLAILHDLNLAASFADTVVAMRGGRIVGRGRPEAVLDDALLADVFGLAPRPAALAPRPIVPQTWGLLSASQSSLGR